MKNKSGLNLENARNEKQKDVMKKIIEDKECPFCHDFVEKKVPAYHTKKIEIENKSWILTKNAWPYVGTKFHFLIVSKKHIVLPEEMDKEETLELWQIVKEAKERFKIKKSTFLMRSGTTKHTGATVEHLHAHLIVGGKGKVVVTRVG